MDADGAAAVGAGPADFFIPQECADAVVLDSPEILDHAHPVFRAVSFVQVLQVVAGIGLALIAVFRSAVLEGRAGLDPAPGTGDWSMNIRCPAAGAWVSLPQISPAYAAVHSAWSYECCFRQGLHCHQMSIY